MTRTPSPSLGVIIPCYNEEAMLPLLFEQLIAFADRLGIPTSFLFVDDGSRDRTFELIEAACARESRFGCIQLSRNFGHQTAVSAGLRYIKGDLVAVIDADLQDPPDIIGPMIEKWKEGYDVVYGVRKNRKEGVLLRLAYGAFYRFLKVVSNISIPLDAGDFSLMDRRIVDFINRMPEHNRFVRGLRGWVGFKQIGIPYDRKARQGGTPKYTLARLWKLALDGIISFSSAPLRLASWLGALSSLIGFVLILWAVVSHVFLHKTPSGWASLAVMMLFFGGIQLLVLGIIGEYVGRVFDEVKNRPQFIVAGSAGWTADVGRNEPTRP